MYDMKHGYQPIKSGSWFWLFLFTLLLIGLVLLIHDLQMPNIKFIMGTS